MTRTAALFLLPALLLAAPHRKPKPKPKPKPATAAMTGPRSVIEDVSVIDVASGRVIPHQDIVIRGERIAEIREAKTRLKNVRYVMPGLWDMHVHLWFPKTQFPEYLENGVTGVRDMGSDLKRVREWQKQAGVPHIYTCGDPLMNRPSGIADMPAMVVKTPAEARIAFDRDYDLHVDCIKVLDISGAVFEALAEASRHGGIPFAGHLPHEVSAFAAGPDRMTSMEHLFGIGLACSRKENELRAKEPGSAVDAEVVDTFDPVAAQALWGEFRRFDVRQTPTLALWERMQKPAQLQFAMMLTGSMAKAGVPILAGTDTGDPGTRPGVTLHHELELLVQAGLTPAQALRAATTEPARMMRRERDYGQVKTGLIADLVILRANPLEQIGNTQSIEKVLFRGVNYDHPRGR